MVSGVSDQLARSCFIIGGMDDNTKRLVIVGGGAAGLAAAIAAGEKARDRNVPLEVEVFERDDRVGRSILATGNGRCNFSNAHPYVDDYNHPDFVEKTYRSLRFAFGKGATDRDYKIVRDNGDEVHAFFYKHGLMWREEDDGRQYPKTNKASTVVDILRASAARAGVREACEHEVSAIELPLEPGGRFTLKMSDSTLERADAVIVACGGRALSALHVASLPMKRQVPVLGPLRCSDACLPIVRELDNIRVRCVVSLVRGCSSEEKVVAEEKGELMFRKYGVSGICVFNLSRFALPGDALSVNFLGYSLCDAKDYLFRRRKLLAPVYGGNITCSDVLRGLLLPRVADAVLKQAGLTSKAVFTKAQVADLAQALVAFRLDVAGIGDADNCQVRRGGFDVKAFDPATMEASDVPRLFAAGEALDVDGPCGGYNLHWAWASGLLAGLSAIDSLFDGDGSAR